MNPTLSICVPTFNRWRFLKDLLPQLIQESDACDGDLEIVISDNNSSDETSSKCLEVICDAKWVHYHKNEVNIGGAGNIVKLVRQLASGKYILVIGDDDALEPGGIRKLIKILKENIDIRYVFLNHTYMPIEVRKTVLDSGSGGLNLNRLCVNDGVGYVEKWEKIIDFSNYAALFTSLVSHVAHRDLWAEGEVNLETKTLFDTFDTTFPHLKILAPQLVGRPVVYMGLPLVHFGIGSQEWFQEHWNSVLATHVLQFAEWMSQNQVDSSLVERYVYLAQREL